MEGLTVVQIMLRHSGGSHPYTDTDRLRVAESFRVDLAAWGGVGEVLSIVQDHLTTEDPWVGIQDGPASSSTGQPVPQEQEE